MIAVLKFLTIVLTACFGVLASLVDFRDNQKRFTRWGVIGLSGVIVSGILAGTLQVYSDWRQEEDSVALLRQVKRGLHPLLPGLSVDYSTTLDWSNPQIHAYQQQAIAKFDFTDGVGWWEYDSMPKSELVDATLGYVYPTIYVFRNPVDPKMFKPAVTFDAAELRVSPHNPCLVPKAELRESAGRCGWFFNLRGGALRALQTDVENVLIEAHQSRWDSSGAIVTLDDLLGSQLLIRLTALGYPPDANVQTLDQLRSKIRLAELRLTLASGVIISFDKDNLSEVRTDDGATVYEYKVPDTVEKFLPAVRYNRFKRIQ